MIGKVEKEEIDVVVIYTDGACRGNPGPGGWGAILRSGSHYKELKGATDNATNNQMELQAAIESLRALKRPSRVNLYTDSTYVKNGVTQWMDKWKRNRWLTSAKKPVKNQQQWHELDALRQAHDVDWYWVKGHAGDPGNERADTLANEAIDELTGASL